MSVFNLENNAVVSLVRNPAIVTTLAASVTGIVSTYYGKSILSWQYAAIAAAGTLWYVTEVTIPPLSRWMVLEKERMTAEEINRIADSAETLVFTFAMGGTFVTVVYLLT